MSEVDENYTIGLGYYVTWRGTGYISEELTTEDPEKLYRIFQGSISGFVPLAHTMCIDYMVANALLDRPDRNNKWLELIWTIEYKEMSTFMLLLREKKDDEIVGRLLDAYPHLLDVHVPNGVHPIFYCELNIQALHEFLKRLSARGDECPKDATGSTPHIVYVLLSRSKNDLAQGCLEMLLKYYPDSQPTTWHVAVSMRKKWLLNLFPGGKVGCCYKTLLHHMVDNEWTDDEICRYVKKHKRDLVPDAHVSYGTALQSMVTSMRWTLIERLWTFLEPYCRTKNYMMAAPIMYIYRSPPWKPSRIEGTEPPENAMPIELRRRFCKASSLHIPAYDGYSPLSNILFYEKWEDVKYWLVGKRLYVRKNHYGESPLDPLSDEEREEFWKLAVGNYMGFLQKKEKGSDEVMKPYRYSDALCVIAAKDAPSDAVQKCLGRILSRCKKTGICYPTPIDWTSLTFPEVLHSTEPLIATGSYDFGLVQLLVIFGRHPDFSFPFHYYDEEVRLSSELLLKTATPATVVGEGHNYHFQYTLQFGNIMVPMAIFAYQYGRVVASQWFERGLRNALRQKRRFVVMLLYTKMPPYSTDLTPNFTHINIVIYDRVKNTVDRFDPNAGSINREFEAETDKNLEIVVCGKIGRITGTRPRYISNFQFEYDKGIQLVDASTKAYWYDREGFCQSWILFYLEARLINIHTKPQRLMKRMRAIITAKGVDSTAYLRAYIRKLNSEMKVHLYRAGVKPEAYYQKINDLNTWGRLHSYVQYCFLNAFNE
jgi:hypothetical protein